MFEQLGYSAFLTGVLIVLLYQRWQTRLMHNILNDYLGALEILRLYKADQPSLTEEADHD